MIVLRGELRCFSCARFLGEFESHPDTHGRDDIHVVEPRGGVILAQQPVATDRGLRCSRCGGRVVTEYVERLAA